MEFNASGHRVLRDILVEFCPVDYHCNRLFGSKLNRLALGRVKDGALDCALCETWLGLNAEKGESFEAHYAGAVAGNPDLRMLFEEEDIGTVSGRLKSCMASGHTGSDYNDPVLVRASF